MADIIMVHGSWHGGWCWDDVSRILERAGHRAHAPTLRAPAKEPSESDKAIDLKTHVDQFRTYLSELEVRDALAVFHSYSGMIAAWLAPELRDLGVRGVILLDAFVPGPNENTFDVVPYFGKNMRLEPSGWAMSIPAARFLGIEDVEQAEAAHARLTLMPILTHTQAIPADIRWPADFPATYIRCLKYPYYADMRERVDGRPGWRWQEIDTGHDAMLSAPEELSRMILDTAAYYGL